MILCHVNSDRRAVAKSNFQREKEASGLERAITIQCCARTLMRLNSVIDCGSDGIPEGIKCRSMGDSLGCAYYVLV
jgi:hypothetical protein